MFKQLELTMEFVRVFAHYASHVRQIIVTLILLILLGGFAISECEGIELGEAIYFALITGLTIGYGDVVPHTTIGKIAAVSIGLLGTLFVGLTVAVANRALHDTVARLGTRRAK